jgi:colanic acid/amylovoran biosynthesis glycosyltransferase
MQVFFKLITFPHISETFIVSNLVYAKKKGYAVKVFVNEYLGVDNSSQKQLLKEYQIQDDTLRPFQFRTSKIVKIFQVVHLLCSIRILTYCYSYYKLRGKRSLQPLTELVQYKRFTSGLIHVHFNNALEPLIKLAQIGYIDPKCIITFHGYDAFLDSNELFQEKYGEFYDKYVVAVTTNSNYLKKEVLQLGIDPGLIKVIPIGIDISIFKGKPKEINGHQTIQLITVGRLVQCKGQVYAIRAVSELVKLGYNVRYLIIGAGYNLQVLKEEVSKLHLTEHVFFEGAKQQDEIVDYMRKTDLFILPSTFDDKVKRREAFGVVSIEAQAMGLPVIGFNSGGFPETFIKGETGFAVEDRNVDLLVEKLAYVMDHSSIYKQMSLKAIDHASTFDFQHTTQQYLDLYRQHTE